MTGSNVERESLPQFSHFTQVVEGMEGMTSAFRTSMKNLISGMMSYFVTPHHICIAVLLEPVDCVIPFGAL